jgi:hypothetical protein
VEIAILIGMTELGHGSEMPHAMDDLVDIVIAVVKWLQNNDRKTLTRTRSHVSANHFA